jgi:hypothetical protein
MRIRKPKMADVRRLAGVVRDPFETIAGAVGVAGPFVEPATGAGSLPRSPGGTTHDTRFDPRAAYRTQSVWGQTLARLSSATFRLFGVQASSTGRLSLSQTSRAEAIQPFRPSREGITRLGSGSQWLVQVVLHAAQNCALRFGGAPT